jgi:hypothetical protein
MKHLYVWTDRAYETYYLGPAFRSLLFALVTLLCFVTLATGLAILLRSHHLLLPRVQTALVCMVLLDAALWVRAYMQHKRIRKFIKQMDMIDRRVVKEVASSSFSFIVTSCLIMVFSLQVISNWLKSLP